MILVRKVCKHICTCINSIDIHTIQYIYNTITAGDSQIYILSRAGFYYMSMYIIYYFNIK